jgi:hypothetical protein
MTGDSSPSTDNCKRQRSEKRALKSTRLALDHVKEAVKNQLMILNECSNKVISCVIVLTVD